jgi:hypothetical protein
VSWSNGGVLLAIVLIASGTTHLARKLAVLRRDNELRPLREGESSRIILPSRGDRTIRSQPERKPRS